MGGWAGRMKRNVELLAMNCKPVFESSELIIYWRFKWGKHSSEWPRWLLNYSYPGGWLPSWEPRRKRVVSGHQGFIAQLEFFAFPTCGNNFNTKYRPTRDGRVCVLEPPISECVFKSLPLSTDWKRTWARWSWRRQVGVRHLRSRKRPVNQLMVSLQLVRYGLQSWICVLKWVYWQNLACALAAIWFYSSAQLSPKLPDLYHMCMGQQIADVGGGGILCLSHIIVTHLFQHRSSMKRPSSWVL